MFTCIWYIFKCLLYLCVYTVITVYTHKYLLTVYTHKYKRYLNIYSVSTYMYICSLVHWGQWHVQKSPRE